MEAENLFRYIASCADMLRTSRVVVFSSVDDTIGAIHANAEPILCNVRAVWNVVGEDFRLTTANLTDGLCLGMEQYTLSGNYIPEGVYELAGWGILGAPDTRKESK
jgi:hypothetical protein